MGFHRLTTPSYFGGLPAGYDRINTPSDPSVGGAGVPALTSAKKSGGPNDGTYFVAFGEDGRSAFANRPALALSENTDLLDDVQRTSIPSITSVDATAVGAVSSIAIVAEVFVGKIGTTNNQTNRDKIVRITDQNNNDLEVSGSKIVVTLMHDGASVNVVGTLASGFRTNATITVAPPIPTTTTYRVWFGTRNSYANVSLVDKGAFFGESMRTVNNVSAEVRSLLRQVHSEVAVNQAWDAAFDSTIRSLAAAGLNERYRRARLQPGGFVTGDFDVPGGGAVIFRDGQALTLQTDTFLLTTDNYRDPNAAALKILTDEARASTAGNSVSTNQGGDFGYWHEVEWRSKTSSDAGQRTRPASSGPALIEVIPWDIRAATYGADTHLTFISPTTATATLNPDAGSGTTDRETVQCAAGQYFSLTAPVRTAIRCGVDLLEVMVSGGHTATYVITEVLTSTRVRVALISGSSPLFSTSAVTGVSLRWIQPIVSVGGNLKRDTGSGGVFSRPLFVIPPSIGTTNPGSEVIGPCTFLGSQTGSVTDAAAQARRARALEWGAMDSPDSGAVVDGSVNVNGWLNGDGSARVRSVDINGTHSISSTGEAILAEITCDDINADDVNADDGRFDTVVINVPETFSGFSEDWLRFQQQFTPDYIIADSGVWEFVETVSTLTLNNGASTSKNPGRLEIIGAGGSSSKEISIYKTSVLPWAFTDIEMVTIVMKIDEDAANVVPQCSIGLRDTVTGLNGGNDSLLLNYLKSVGQWRLTHRKAGASGSANNTNLGAFVDNVFVVVRFRKNAANGIDVYFNDVLIVTIAVADLPDGNCTFGGTFTQTVADANATTFVVDECSLRSRSGVRSGA